MTPGAREGDCCDLARMGSDRGARPPARASQWRVVKKTYTRGGVEMRGKGWLTVGLSVLLGTGVAGAMPGVGVRAAQAESGIARGIVTGHDAQVQAARWGDEN